MVYMMKNFNIFGVHRKIRLLGVFMKNQFRGGAWTVSHLKGAWQERGGGGVFEGG